MSRQAQAALPSYQKRPLSDIAVEISTNWDNVNYGAKPYLDAMGDLDSVEGRYLCDSAYSVVAYFLANATTWRGEKAREIKAELNALLKGKKTGSKVAQEAETKNWWNHETPPAFDTIKNITEGDEEEPVDVVFRVFSDDHFGGVIALFPDLDWGNGECASYMQVGQHSGADFKGCMDITSPATLEEYTPLMNELASIGYIFKNIRTSAKKTAFPSRPLSEEDEGRLDYLQNKFGDGVDFIIQNNYYVYYDEAAGDYKRIPLADLDAEIAASKKGNN